MRATRRSAPQTPPCPSGVMISTDVRPAHLARVCTAPATAPRARLASGAFLLPPPKNAHAQRCGPSCAHHARHGASACSCPQADAGSPMKIASLRSPLPAPFIPSRLFPPSRIRRCSRCSAQRGTRSAGRGLQPAAYLRMLGSLQLGWNDQMRLQEQK
ncbi:LAFE_0D02190g1_1 [Lachancea fermentati]|uniref:LAFE_0D02190g1_1 n=1 Tax=Lachancea fermentati TaxID=4955 RepID=A0A1G4MB43_LACFM|nr:LAFE_0D02190g1_1 [Lachancea fermentati]